MFRFLPPPWRPLALLTTLLALTGSCKKDDGPGLPAATQSGANTFGCKIDGQVWVPGGHRTSSGKPRNFSLVYYPSDPTGWFPGLLGRFALTTYRKNDDHDDSVVLALDSLTGPGTYTLTERTAPYPFQRPYPNHGAFFVNRPTAATYVTSPAHTGTLVVTRLDTAAHIVAGTFSFTAGSYGGSEAPVQITDGRFDINYSSQ